MNRYSLVCLCTTLLCGAGCSSEQSTQSPAKLQRTLETSRLPSLPAPVANNAVANVVTSQGRYLVSFNGLSVDKKWSSPTAHTFFLGPGANGWEQAPDVPGMHGRLASIAVAVGDKAYVFGGYTVAENHDEVSLPLVHRFDPVDQSFTQLADMPVPVDDAMALVYQERYIYLISGWHDSANVNLVQRYDTKNDRWVQATAYPGAPVFGHAGGIVGNQMVVCGGVEIKTHAKASREFVMNTRCFAGALRQDDARRIDWRSIDPMPGAARYRMAATGSRGLDAVVFVGGSDNPYNYNGVGYNGVPSEPVREVWAYSLKANQWRGLGAQVEATMDHRGLLETPDGFVTVGGMLSGQEVSAHVISYAFDQSGIE